MEADPKINILVVDDVPEKIIAMEAILEELGQNVVSVTSGREALRALLNQDFAVILLDVNMPEIDGFETAALIRQRKRSEHTPIIFITAFSDETHINQGYKLGAVDYILTPVVPEVLRAKVAVFADLFRKNELVRRQAEQRIEFEREQAARTAAEEANRRSAFLAEASTVLARSLDFAATVTSTARLAVPTLGDACVVAVADAVGRLSHFELACTELYRRELTDQSEEHPLGEAAAQCAERVFASGSTEHLSRAELIHSSNGSGRRDSLGNVNGVESPRAERPVIWEGVVTVPLMARGKILGTMTVARCKPSRSYTEVDIRLAEDLAGRAALAIDNARLYQEIREGNRRKDEFLAMLGHELRNPLGAVSNALHCLDLGSEDKDLFEEAKVILNRQFKHVSRLVDDLLDVSRITQGKVQLRREVVELRRVIEGAVTSARSFIVSRRHELSVSIPSETVRLKADPTRVEQVLSNLLHNAAKYSEPGGHIWLSAEVEGSQVAIHIKDSGIGIDPDLLPRVFDLFTQADRSLDRSQGGLGIGLTLARSLVHLHGGELRAASAGLGQGSEFTVTLPRIIEHRSTQAADLPIEAARSHPTSSRRILLVDDNTDLAAALSGLMRRQGHDVRIAHDGHQAIDVASTFLPEVGLVDIGLPGMTGFEVAQRLRQLPGFDRVVLVAMTGYGQPEDRRRSAEAGFDHHLVKPVPPEQIQKILSEMEVAPSAAT